MSRVGSPNDLSLLELFRIEVDGQAALLTEGVLALEQGADPTARAPEIMRAAHSLKGAARIVGREAAVRLSHAVEGCMADIQKKNRGLSRPLIDTLLQTVDTLGLIAQVSDEELETWQQEHESAI